MSSLNPQERFILMTMVLVIFAGSLLRFIYRHYPQLGQILNVMEMKFCYFKINVNRASVEDLDQIPYLGEKTAQRIIQYREQNGPLQSLEQVRTIPGIYASNFDKFSAFLEVRP